MKSSGLITGAVLVLMAATSCSTDDAPDGGLVADTSTAVSTSDAVADESPGRDEGSEPCVLVPLTTVVEVGPLVEATGLDLVAVFAMAGTAGIEEIEAATGRIADALGPPRPENAGLGVTWDPVNQFVLLYAPGDVDPTVLADVVRAAEGESALRRIDGIDCPPGATG